VLNVQQTKLKLSPLPRGIHLITSEVQSALHQLGVRGSGLVHVFIQHTSASLSLNENADADVRLDMEDHLRRLVPDDTSLFRHTAEGPDDMTSHIKASLLGASLTIPLTDGRLALGTWQGIYLCEHREMAGSRHLVITVMT
jgi:secondary thiamine-phosphate synthase enzyme